jgi:hypothetical protein
MRNILKDGTAPNLIENYQTEREFLQVSSDPILKLFTAMTCDNLEDRNVLLTDISVHIRLGICLNAI